MAFNHGQSAFVYVIAASILQYLSPNGAMERVMKLVLGAFVLYGIMNADYQVRFAKSADGFDVYIDTEQPNHLFDLNSRLVNSQIHTAASSGDTKYCNG